MLGAALDKLQNLSSAAALSALSIGALAFIATALYPSSPSLRILTWGVPAVLVVLGMLALERNGSLSHSKSLETLGNASYSIYLSHGSVVAALAKTWPTQLSPITFLLFSVAASVVVGLVTYSFIERPTLRALRLASGTQAPQSTLLAARRKVTRE
jgi:exopolysaccharide production protein ExoZ